MLKLDESLKQAESDLPSFEELLPINNLISSHDEVTFRSEGEYLEILKQYTAETNARKAAQLAAREETKKKAPVKPATAPAEPKSRVTHTKIDNSNIAENFGTTSYPLIQVSAMPPIKFELISDNLRLEQIIDPLLHEQLLGVDTETSGLDPFTSKLLLVQIASPEICYIIDASKVRLTPLKRLLENPRILKILQNAKFDYEMLKERAGIVLENIYDTMLAERLLTAGVSKENNLTALVKRYTGEIMDKEVRKTFYGANSIGHVSQDQLMYAARDALCLFPIYSQQLAKLKEEKMFKVADLEFRCVAAVGDLELAGCKLDTVKWRAILAEVEKKRDLAREELMGMLPGGATKQASMFGNDEYLINLNSSQQIMTEFGKLGIALEDTSEATLNKHNHPAVKKLLEYRSLEKTLGSFGESLLSQVRTETGRIHPDFIQYGADTGRFSCSNPNVQQIPATSDFRSCFIAQEGYKLITCDYSQAELRILAELSSDPAFLEAFRSGGDLHKLAASQMFQVRVEDVSKEQRNAAKAINFGLAYGMGPQGLAVRIDKTVDEARELITAYFKAFSGVQKWLDKAGRDSVKRGYSPTPLGRKRYYNLPSTDDPDYRKRSSEIERQGKNAPIQGCNADMTKMALVFLRERLAAYDARIVNTVHDEIVVEVREDQAEEVCKLVEHEMVRAGHEILKEVPIVADAKIGDYWSK
ncbi:DNA polymerase [Candidatus Chlorohelix sp.]|uniref:DNA polymerase n=1 Tax=Candidatus Chlorohelix sp. TaxID=3139201 RepID=UPI00304BBADC